jgi:hypothetical protein
VRGPRHGPIGRRGELTGLERLAEEVRDGGGVEPVPQRRERLARLGQVPLGGGVVVHGREERISAGGLVTRVQDALRTSGAERADRNLGELLQELRVAGLGVQVLFGFLLTVGLAVSAAVLLVADFVTGGLAAALITALIACMFGLLWFAFPLTRR